MQIHTTLEKVNNAITAIRDNGGRVVVNGSKGSVDVKGVSGRFEFDQDTGILIFSITDKPFLVSTEFVESKIREFFE